MHSANYASTQVGTRVWAVMDSKHKVLETNESLDKLSKKWGNKYIYTIIIDQHDKPGRK